jgi:EAL domain-containing protein (putative c-di-GMP-specific phosphodiesterase class I)
VFTERVQELVTRPVVVDGHPISITVRIGVVLNAGKYGTDDAVFRAATTALNAVPSRGRKKLQVYRTAMLEQAALGLRIEAELARAVERGEIVVHYQPIVTMTTLELVGFEALVRWVRRSGGVVSPLDFIPIAESSGSIVPIGREVLRQSCRSLAEWRNAGQCGPDVAIAVNVSAVQFEHGSLYDDVTAALADAGLPARCLKIEVTESVMMEDLDAHARTLQRLRSDGVRVSMDDFGTGHSSLAYLQQLPIDVLKVDRSFVSKMHSDAESAQIVRTVLELARGLGLRVVAEGVETERDFNALAAQGCDHAQGYFLSRPLSAQAALAFLGDWRDGATSAQRTLAGSDEVRRREPVAVGGAAAG